jgi:type I restriction enzyme S subunit
VKWKSIKLGELFASERRTVDPADFPREVFDLYSVAAYDAKIPVRLSGAAIGSAKQSVAQGDVLLCRIVPHIRRAWVVGSSNGHRLIGSGEWIVLRHKDIFPDFLKYFLLSDPFHSKFMLTVAGVGGSLLRARPVAAAEIDVPLAPLDEQRRIAAILDKIDMLRQMRCVAIGKLEFLTQSIFFEMFGDLFNREGRWKSKRLIDLLEAPLRNGLSPSNTGTIRGSVLTLSAITGRAFLPSAVKEATFHTKPPEDQTVDERDLLICRGNGNLNLVGKGYFPLSTMPSVLFPDTMIAARVSPCVMKKEFLAFVWNSYAVRSQVETLARTTNGTLKVNQTMLEGIELMYPPLAMQEEFSLRVRSIERLRKKSEAALEKADAAFESIQHRAFRGDL